MWDPIAIEANGGDLHRVEIVAALEGLGLDLEPGIPNDWREAYSTPALEELLAAREDEDFETVDQAIAGANAELAAWH